mgnify:FL=1
MRIQGPKTNETDRIRICNSLVQNTFIQTNWPAIKKLDLAHNKLNALPALLGDCLKLKELNILNNPLADNR